MVRRSLIAAAFFLAAAPLAAQSQNPMSGPTESQWSSDRPDANGPMGVFEMDAFAQGTLSVARAVAKSKGYSLVGGGDSLAAIKAAGVADEVGHASTGGGATLELLAGRSLPGVEALTDRGDA